MPQSLSAVAPDAEIHLHSTGAFPLRGHDQLARLGLEAIAAWSNVESAVLNLYADLCGGDRSEAISAFLALETNSVRARALSLLEGGVPGPHRQHFEQLVELFRTRAQSRDRLAHWVWGSAPLVPRALLLCDPAVLAARSPEAPIDATRIAENILVFRESDFLDIIGATERLAACARHLRSLLANPSATTRPTESAEARRELEDMLSEVR